MGAQSCSRGRDKGGQSRTSRPGKIHSGGSREGDPGARVERGPAARRDLCGRPPGPPHRAIPPGPQRRRAGHQPDRGYGLRGASDRRRRVGLRLQRPPHPGGGGARGRPGRSDRPGQRPLQERGRGHRPAGGPARNLSDPGADRSLHRPPGEEAGDPARRRCGHARRARDRRHRSGDGVHPRAQDLCQHRRLLDRTGDHRVRLRHRGDRRGSR
jgi:hypothetical protein